MPYSIKDSQISLVFWVTILDTATVADFDTAVAAIHHYLDTQPKQTEDEEAPQLRLELKCSLSGKSDDEAEKIRNQLLGLLCKAKTVFNNRVLLDVNVHLHTDRGTEFFAKHVESRKLCFNYSSQFRTAMPATALAFCKTLLMDPGLQDIYFDTSRYFEHHIYIEPYAPLEGDVEAILDVLIALPELRRIDGFPLQLYSPQNEKKLLTLFAKLQALNIKLYEAHRSFKSDANARGSMGIKRELAGKFIVRLVKENFPLSMLSFNGILDTLWGEQTPAQFISALAGNTHLTDLGLHPAYGVEEKQWPKLHAAASQNQTLCRIYGAEFKEEVSGPSFWKTSVKQDLLANQLLPICTGLQLSNSLLTLPADLVRMVAAYLMMQPLPLTLPQAHQACQAISRDYGFFSPGTPTLDSGIQSAQSFITIERIRAWIGNGEGKHPFFEITDPKWMPEVRAVLNQKPADPTRQIEQLRPIIEKAWRGFHTSLSKEFKLCDSIFKLLKECPKAAPRHEGFPRESLVAPALAS